MAVLTPFFELTRPKMTENWSYLSRVRHINLAVKKWSTFGIKSIKGYSLVVTGCHVITRQVSRKRDRFGPLWTTRRWTGWDRLGHSNKDKNSPTAKSTITHNLLKKTQGIEYCLKRIKSILLLK